jgi:exopolysaccharide biosynthesis polyprenyl glycosylphosphotransferase
MYGGLWGALGLRSFTLPSLSLWQAHVPIFSITFGCWLLINYINGLYDTNRVYTARRYTETGAMALVAGISFFYIFGNADIAPKTILLIATALTYVGITFWHTQFSRLAGNVRLQTKVAFVGMVEEAHMLIQILRKEPERGYHIAAIVYGPSATSSSATYEGITVFSKMEDMRKDPSFKDISTVILAPHIQQEVSAMQSLYPLLFSDVSVRTLSDFYEEITGRIPPSLFSEDWFLSNLKKERNPLYHHIRRGIDLLAVCLIGSVFLIMFPLIALLIKITSPGPLFFKQKRTGLYGEIFWMYKLRSMYALSPDGSAELHGFEFAKKEDKRVTPVGKWLRRMRIDELPQLWNLVRGDITLIGPRPERPEIVAELEAQMPYYALRNMVKPGLTGWAVLHQDYTDTMAASLEKLQYDLYYIKNRSLMLDIAILLKTIDKIIRMKGQ